MLRIPTDPPNTGFVGWARKAATTVNQIIGKLSDYLPLTGGALTGDLSVPDEAYGAGWDGSTEVPTKNALYDKIETIAAGGVSDGDKGDITVSGSGATWTIDNDVVTYAKMQNVSATSRFLGRITAGSGDPEELTSANAKTILALAQADISGLTTVDSPQLAGLNLGHASDTTLTRAAAGVVAVEGVNVLTDLGVLHVRDVKASGTDAGTFTSGAWQTRTLNTTVLNTIASAALASNQISLPAGTYEIYAKAPGFRVSNHQAKLVNITDTADILLGTTEYADNGTDGEQTSSIIQGRFTLSGTKTIELQHRCSSTLASTGLGFGTGNSWGSTVFADVFLKRIA